MSYIVQGYVFISLFDWVAFKSNEKFEHMITKSIVASYILKLIFTMTIGKYIPNANNFMIILIITSALLAIWLGKLFTSHWFNKLLLNIGIKRTFNSNIWDDVIKPNTWLRVYLKDPNTSYLGQYAYGEEFKSEPIIVLKTYQILNIDGCILSDYSQDPNSSVMLNTKNFERIEIVYCNNT